MTTSELLTLSGKKILAVNPPVEDFAFFDLWSKPLGFLYLLEKLKGKNEVVFIDCIHEGAVKEKSFGREKIAETEIEKPQVYAEVKRKYRRFGMPDTAFQARLESCGEPDLILVTSVMTYWYGGVKHAIEILKRHFPNTPLYLGGIYARLCPEHAAALGADEVLTDFWLPDAPHPAFELYEKPPYGITMTSFGCPMRCQYCASSLLWPVHVHRTAEEILAEIEFEASLGIENIAFYDDALLIQKEKYFYPLANAVKTRFNGNLALHTPNGLHVREIDSECAETLKSANFQTLRLSLESIDPDIARASSGKVERQQYKTAVKNLLAAGYAPKDCETYILLGLPGQSLQSVKETIDFARDCGGTPKLAEFSPIPGTPLFEEAAKKIPALCSEPLLQNNSVYSSFVSHTMSEETLQELKNYSRKK